MTQQQFLEQLNSILDQNHLLKHPFYQMWNEGKLDLAMLQEYAQEYYLQVHNFPTYVSATHAACDDIKIRQMLLENLIEEERGAANHPELWLRFAEGLGLDRNAVLSREHLEKTSESVRILKDLARSESPAKGLAALYAYEAQIPEVSTTKIAGLKEFYGIDSQAALSFFQVHEKADEFHSQATGEALLQVCETEEAQQEALLAAQKATFALNLLLDGVYETYCQANN
ncbi:MAG: CADD family putative folate metabolism protein [Microcoleus sp. PH2017_10_PVI_O_A]|uniref:CADD family putative folate metabolism protein n=1 Tax=unclassified Microcoleus TaxID=2642155 RepID=UPI001DFE4AD7|nr:MULTISPECIES: CADD family putative folate metabolism protein [unclassified Microcoleus]TAE74453.1 MAG: CADD family putative folate metabolism protein [Oscillatoriales cyanobacterium]MCC3409733.1 CADD family putative folate metabolism protein [Microcoleus sp. PH2017_10_PVI_O_A]MCC3463999.1 CADD family putative folate metabolism protein [Microcoleus sp. PH2017_11_PCY_U_A]MCC3482330.1 CADD family putative folate metabolism protein [Microcoleus sp. PH2017_12_PCY_D_A]MCC3532165.1 CADD family put